MRDADFRSDVNGLRGLSVALVVAYHLQFRGAGGGFVGVDVFFVISGYLMTRIVWSGIAQGGFGYGHFVLARARRIWPALAVMLLLLFALGAVLLPPFDLRIVGEQAQWAALFASNEYFRANSGYNIQSSGTRWLLHTWSLSVEWQFYLLYPLLLVAVARIVRARRPGMSVDGLRRVMLVVIVLGIVGSLGWQATLIDGDPDASFFLLPGRAWEMLAGGLACLAGPAHPAPAGRWRVVASHAGLAIVVAAALGIAYFRLRPVGLGPYLLPLVGGVALLLWADHRQNPLLRQAWLQQLGLCSYSLYLWHWPIFVGLRLTTFAMDHPRTATVLALLASLIAGWCSYRWVERPAIARGAAPRDLGRRALLLALPLALPLAVAAAFGIVATEGLASRDREGDAAYRTYRASVPPLYFPDSCSNFRKPADAMTICRIEKDPRRRILVIGDSHAEHLYAWFVARSEVSVDFFAASECPPVPNFERLQPGYHCRDYAAKAWAMARSATYDTVIVSARWATVGLAGPPYCHRVGAQACRFPTGTAKQQQVMAELQAAVEQAIAAGKTVVMLDSAPEARLRIPEHAARERFWHGEVRLTIPLQSLLDQTQWMEPLLQRLQTTPGFHRASLRERLCKDSSCRILDKELNRPIYVDDSHFDPIWITNNADFLTEFAALPRH